VSASTKASGESACPATWSASRRARHQRARTSGVRGGRPSNATKTWAHTPVEVGTVEGRMLDLTDLDERKIGSLAMIYLGDNFKVGVGYNFNDSRTT
jgi:hypothetical protein